MRHYYTADGIRQAEAPLLASMPEGALMRRAAYPLSVAIARELTAAPGASRAGASVRWWDPATTAATHVVVGVLRRRGAAASAVLLNPEKTHKRGSAAFIGPAAG